MADSVKVPSSVARILVPVDGSPHSGRAVDMALDLAKKYGATLYIIHVAAGYAAYERFGEAYEGRVNPEILAETAVNAVHSQGEQYLQDVDARAKAEGLSTVERVYAAGDPADEIINFAEQNHVDLIVMGSRGLGRFSRVFLGSVSNKVAHHAHCTVIIVK
jgi:nucleotide-binding universal stress UspA family protein